MLVFHIRQCKYDHMAKRPYSMERFFQALGDKTRLRLLNLIGEQEICVCYLVEILEAPQPKISRHLAYLRSAGMVDARREGKWMHYRIVMPPNAGAAQILRQTLLSLKDEKEMRADRVRLAKALGIPAQWVALQGVPSPRRSGKVAGSLSTARSRDDSGW